MGEWKVSDYVGAIEAFTKVSGSGLGHFNAGYARFLSPVDPRYGTGHVWSFLLQSAVISLSPTETAVADATYDAESDTSTVVSETPVFEQAHILKALTYDGSQYKIIDYRSPTTVVVDGELTFTSESISVSGRGIALLPSDFGGMVGPTRWRTLDNATAINLEAVSYEDMASARNRSSASGLPTAYAIGPYMMADNGAQRWALYLAPRPSVGVIGEYEYRRAVPPYSEDDMGVVPLGGQWHRQTILYAALSDAEVARGRIPGPMEARYRDYLAASIDYDKDMFRLVGSEYL